MAAHRSCPGWWSSKPSGVEAVLRACWRTVASLTGSPRGLVVMGVLQAVKSPAGPGGGGMGRAGGRSPWCKRIRRTVSAMIWNTSSGLARPSCCWTGIRPPVSSTRSTGGSWSVSPISSCGWRLPWRFGYPDRGSATQPPRPHGRYRGRGRCNGSSSELFGSLGHRPGCPNGGVIPLGGRLGTVPVAVRANRWCSNAGLALDQLQQVGGIAEASDETAGAVKAVPGQRLPAGGLLQPLLFGGGKGIS